MDWSWVFALLGSIVTWLLVYLLIVYAFRNVYWRRK